jgi:type I restriction enzyme M protein
MAIRHVEGEVIFLNPSTCGLYKNGGPRYKQDASGERTDVIDDELNDHTKALVNGADPPGARREGLEAIFKSQVLVPRYFDRRWNDEFEGLCKRLRVDSVSLGDLVDEGVLLVRGGHGSPSNDKRTGRIPYVKVSDIRSLRVNVNPTNLVSEEIARSFWRGEASGIEPWDLVTPNRASSNIGEFAVFLPGETEVVITKEVFVLRVVDGEDDGWTPFYLMWALCLKAVRREWNRITLMQTNREDVNSRYREILIPRPPSKKWADEQSAAFRKYFTSIAKARQEFAADLKGARVEYIASASGAIVPMEDPEEE